MYEETSTLHREAIIRKSHVLIYSVVYSVVYSA